MVPSVLMRSFMSMQTAVDVSFLFHSLKMKLWFIINVVVIPVYTGLQSKFHSSGTEHSAVIPEPLICHDTYNMQNANTH